MWHFQKTLCHITNTESRHRRLFLFTHQWVWDIINYNIEGKVFRMLSSSRKKKKSIPFTHEEKWQFSFNALISDACYTSSQTEGMWYSVFSGVVEMTFQNAPLLIPQPAIPWRSKPARYYAVTFLWSDTVWALRFYLCQDIFTQVTHLAEAQAGRTTLTPFLLRLSPPQES